MKVYEIPLTLAEHDSDIKIKACTQKSLSFVTRFCAYNLLRYQVSVYRTIGPLVILGPYAWKSSMLKNIYRILTLALLKALLALKLE